MDSALEHPVVIFVAADATYCEVSATPGETLLETALRHGVPGIVGACGGSCTCATCHVFVEADWMDAVGQPGAEEEDRLATIGGARPNSRLSCQIRITEALDGLIVTTPRRQG